MTAFSSVLGNSANSRFVTPAKAGAQRKRLKSPGSACAGTTIQAMDSQSRNFGLFTENMYDA
jgi:hypothetical protein